MKTILLTGPKHSGKTSAGKALAALCSCVFVDLDEEIERRAGKSPRALYAEAPEVFRKAEAETLAALFAGSCALCVIAAGGGITANAAAVSLLEGNKNLLPVYLDVSAETAWQRICASGGLPPFLQTENPKESHRALHEERAASCRKLAALTVSAEGKTPEEIAREIFQSQNCAECFSAFYGN